MTTTSFLQAGPDFWPSREEALAHTEEKNTNKTYPNFLQDIFHAGDEYQFQLYRYPINGEACSKLPSLSNNLFEDITLKDYFEVWSKYKNVDADASLNTFRYIFHKFKKGIFVKIQDNKLKVFLPFSKANFTNEWHEKIEQNIIQILKDISEAEGRRFDEKSVKTVNKNIKEWF